MGYLSYSCYKVLNVHIFTELNDIEDIQDEILLDLNASLIFNRASQLNWGCRKSWEFRCFFITFRVVTEETPDGVLTSVCSDLTQSLHEQLPTSWTNQQVKKLINHLGETHWPIVCLCPYHSGYLTSCDQRLLLLLQLGDWEYWSHGTEFFCRGGGGAGIRLCAWKSVELFLTVTQQ